MNALVQQLKADLQDEEGRYSYADTVTNAFIAAQIKALQKARGLTQTELASLMGTKQPGISRLQRTDYGSWKIETLRKFAKAFDVRLRIRFEEFGTLKDEITGFNDKNLIPKKFEDDPILNGTKRARRFRRATGPRPKKARKPAARDQHRIHPSTQLLDGGNNSACDYPCAYSPSGNQSVPGLRSA
jgi:transcriptional regulator with XRE-family HTH domain